MLMLHDKVHGVTDLTTPKALEDLLRRRYRERGSFLIVKRAKAKVVYTAFLQLHELRNHVNYLSSIENTVYGLAIDHGSKIGKSEYVWREKGGPGDLGTGGLGDCVI
jgi:hypothetical protein